jgi:hypothetical protein
LTFLYYNRFREVGEGTSIPSGLYNLDGIKKWGKSRNWCPCYLIHRAINRQVVDSGLQRRRQGWLMVGGVSGNMCTSSR